MFHIVKCMVVACLPVWYFAFLMYLLYQDAEMLGMILSLGTLCFGALGMLMSVTWFSPRNEK